MKIYQAPPSPNCRKVLAAVAYLKRPDVELQFVDIFKGETKAADFLEINPNGRLPALVDGDLKLWESNAILQYLAEKSDNRLYSADPVERADICRWMSWQLAHWEPALRILTYENFAKELFGHGPTDTEEVERGYVEFHRVAPILESHLLNRRYVVGERFTIADIALASMLTYAGPAQHPLNEYPNISRWNASLDEIEAWRSTMPQQPVNA